MCLISLAWGAHPDYPLVLAANRDEFYDRPTLPLSAWQTSQGHTIVGGRDLRDGGTWMGFTPGGRFACLTNVRAPMDEPPSDKLSPGKLRSRGELPVAWLTSQQGAAAWASGVEAQAYAGFNLIVGDWHAKTCLYISNKQEKTMNVSAGYAQAATNSIANALPRSIHWHSIVGLSNAALDTPWPKTQKLKAVMASGLQGQPSLHSLQQQLHTALQDHRAAPPQDLPHTGVGLDRETALSSVFVRYPADAPHYGTRASLVAVLDAAGSLHLQETTHPHGQTAGSASYILAW